MSNIIEPPSPPPIYPILTETLFSDNPSRDKRNKEGLVFKHFSKKGFRGIGVENQPIYDLFFHLGFEKFLLKPNWKKWDKNKTIRDYPHLTEHLNYPFEIEKKSTNPKVEEDRKNIKTYREMVDKQFCNVPLEWMYSDECIYLNGKSLLFGEGVYYQMFKEEIDDFIDDELPNRDIPLMMKENYDKVKGMREKYKTLFNWGGMEGDTETLEIIYNNLPLKLVQFIMRKQFENFYRYRSGFMDCWMWNKKDEHLKLVEVKGIGENILPHQNEWLNIFYDYGVDVSVLRVKIQK
jgi:hypothetical protein